MSTTELSQAYFPIFHKDWDYNANALPNVHKYWWVWALIAGAYLPVIFGLQR
jgi:hypothetical protein